MPKRSAAIAIAAVVLVVAVGYGLWPSKGLRARDLQCTAIPDARAQSICRRLQQEMQWSWFGHAIIAPGWRVSFESVRRTYCAEHVGPDDIASLELLRRAAKDWRAESGAESLLRLVRNKDGAGDEDVASIFNPANPSFLLKHGCAP